MSVIYYDLKNENAKRQIKTEYNLPDYVFGVPYWVISMNTILANTELARVSKLSSLLKWSLKEIKSRPISPLPTSGKKLNDKNILYYHNTKYPIMSIDEKSHQKSPTKTFEILSYDVLEDIDVEAYYVPSFLSQEEADNYYDILLNKYCWKQDQSSMWIGGQYKTFDQPRLTGMMSDKERIYGYSGHERLATAWIPEVETLSRKISNLAKSIKKDHPNFNIVVGNYYANGEKYIAKHRDNETIHDRDSFIAGLSLGAKRDFMIRDRKGNILLTLPLAHGSVFIMGKNFQEKLTHEVPKRLRVKEGRINLTFRYHSDN